MNERPELLHYYCSAGTFLSLMQKKQLWLTAIDHSNDEAEGHWAKREYLRKFDRSASARLKRKKAEIILDLCMERLTPLGMCFSEEADLLSQWRGYAENGAGYCVSFETSKLDRLISRSSSQCSNLKLAKISYSSIDEAENFVKEIANLVNSSAFKVDVGDTSIAMSVDNTADLTSIVERFYEFKNPAFFEEQEWRLYAATGFNEQELKYRNRGNQLTRHLELSFDASSISAITIGPTNPTQTKTVDDAAKAYGINAWVKRSQASYR